MKLTLAPSVVPLVPYHEVCATLRRIADEIEADAFGEVRTAGLVIMGSATPHLHVFAFGSDSADSLIALLLQAGARSISDGMFES